jgi:hypothetical protein
MKSLFVLTAIAVLTVGSAIAGKPATFGPDKSAARASQPMLMMAEQELPFDRYWSKN